MDNLFDAVESLALLSTMSKDVDYSKHSVKKVGIFKDKGVHLTWNFFKELSYNDKRIVDSIKKYTFSIKEVPWVEGGLFLNDNNDVRILVPTLDNVFSTSILVHECTHALDVEHIIDLDCDDSHAEILPFLNQFLFIDSLKDNYDIEELQKSHMDYMIYNNLLYNVNKYVGCADKEDIDYDGIQKHFKYVLGSLYSIVLYEWYKNDKDFMNNYSKVYTKDETLKSLLDYYGIRLGDIDNIKFVKSLMKK